MPRNQPAVSAPIREVLDDPSLAHDNVFRRMLQAGLQDLVEAEADGVCHSPAPPLRIGREVARFEDCSAISRPAPRRQQEPYPSDLCRYRWLHAVSKRNPQTSPPDGRASRPHTTANGARPS